MVVNMIYGDIFYLLLEIVLGILCFWIAGYAEKNCNSKFKLVYILPVFVTIFAVAGNGWDKALLPAYIFSFALLTGFFLERKNLRNFISVLLILAAVIEFPLCNFSKAYRQPDYLAEFEEGFSVMQERYHMAEHKGIDWQQLYEEYQPKFKEVSKDYDAVENAILWQYFTQEFHDGHTYYVDYDQEVMTAAFQKMYGEDFGFSLIPCEDGSIAAINVEPESMAEKAGIKNGTVITKWNQEPVEQMISSFDAPLSYGSMPVKENDEFLRVVHAAGQGQESITITFLDGEGMEKEAVLNSNGFYYDRLEDTLELLMAGDFENNLNLKQINERTAAMRLSEMSYDDKSYSDGDYSKMEEELRGNLQELKDAGVKDLIIDLRDNSGGDPLFDIAIFKFLFPKGEHTLLYDGIWDPESDNYAMTEDEKFAVGKDVSFQAEGMWGDGRIVLLVNANTVSAGDLFVKAMSELDNVTVMGITTTNGSCQGVRGVEFEKGCLSFSAVPNLTEDGEIFIDSDEYGMAAVSLDERIPIDEKLIDAVFNRGEDYTMEMAVEYLDSADAN